jgi:hypothetical protein
MSIVVQKYGGSSVADVSRIRQVADRVMRTRREGHDFVVVPLKELLGNVGFRCSRKRLDPRRLNLPYLPFTSACTCA